MVVTMTSELKAKSKSVSELDMTDDSSSPCMKCNKTFDPPFKAIQCGKCKSWVHFECSDLNNEQYKFLCKRTTPSSIKWFCPPCEVKVESIEQNTITCTQNETIDKLANMVMQITKQNAEILQNMNRDKMVEERLKSNVKEVLDSNDRDKNMIIYNLPEEEEEGEDEDEEGRLDKRQVAQVCNFLSYSDSGDYTEFDPVDMSYVRLGQKRKPNDSHPSPKPRPIKVYLNNVEIRDRLLRNAKKLKDSALSYIGVSADKTKDERARDYEIRMKFKARKSAGEDVVLYRGEIFLRSEKPWQKKVSQSGGAGAAAQVAAPTQ